MTDVEQLLKQLGWRYKETSGGTELLVETCPYCGKNKHFYVNRQTGRFYCQHGACNARGGIYQLQVFARQAIPIEAPPQPPSTLPEGLYNKVELWHQNLWSHKEALDFLLNTRKVSRKAVMHFKLGVLTEYGVDWIVMPHIYRGKVLTLKYRRLDKKQYRHLKNTQLGLYNQDVVDGEGEIIIAEGELDCISLWSNGYRNVVAIPGAGQWKPEWMDMFSRFNKIYICMDSDDAGRLGAKELAKKLGYDRCHNVALPIGIKDVNDFFIASSKGKSKFQRILDKARLVDVPYVIKASDSIRDVILKRRVAGDSEVIKTPWEGLNTIIHGIVPESLVIVTSYPGTGKSTAVLQWLYHLAQEGKPVGYVCIEMSSEEMTNRLLTLHTTNPLPTPEDKIQALQDLGDYPLYWIDLAKHGGVKFEILAETLRDAVPRYDLKVIVVDHMHFMVRSVKYTYQETGQLTQRFKLLARELGIPIICVAHVTKPVLRADGTPKKLVGSDLRDCVPGDQLVYRNGKRIQVKDIKPGMPVISLGSSLCLQNDVVKDVWETGEKDIYRLTTKTGRVIECSDGHRFFATTYRTGIGQITEEDKQGPIINNNRLVKGNRNKRGMQRWTELKNLKVGQKIAIVKSYPDIEKETISVERACLLGWIIGDGSIRSQGYTEGTTHTFKEAIFIKKIADKEFNLNCKVARYKDKKAFRIYLTGNGRKPNKIAEWFRNQEFHPIGKHKYIPNIVFEQPKEIIGAFLSGLFHADGTVKNNVGNKKNTVSPLIKLSTVSKQLAYDVQHLLTRLGIVSYVYSCNMYKSGFRTKNKVGWEVRFAGSNILQFEKYSNFYFDKQDKFKKLTKNWKPKDKIRKTDLFFDRVKSIEYVGKKKTYDIQVEGNHCSLNNHSLCINDILTHNSGLIYGDSDYIFILHRKPLLGADNTWEGEWENEVEIGIFKSRHSGKGSIKGLEFFGEIGKIL